MAISDYERMEVEAILFGLSPLLNPLDVIAASVEQPQGPVDRRPKEISHLNLDVQRWPKKLFLACVILPMWPIRQPRTNVLVSLYLPT